MREFRKTAVYLKLARMTETEVNVEKQSDYVMYV